MWQVEAIRIFIISYLFGGCVHVLLRLLLTESYTARQVAIELFTWLWIVYQEVTEHYRERNQKDT